MRRNQRPRQLFQSVAKAILQRTPLHIFRFLSRCLPSLTRCLRVHSHDCARHTWIRLHCGGVWLWCAARRRSARASAAVRSVASALSPAHTRLQPSHTVAGRRARAHTLDTSCCEPFDNAPAGHRRWDALWGASCAGSLVLSLSHVMCLVCAKRVCRLAASCGAGVRDGAGWEGTYKRLPCEIGRAHV